MNHLAFKWDGPVALDTELQKPLEKVFLHIEHPAWGGPTFVMLQRTDGSSLVVHSQMHDVAERREVGVLNFAYGHDPANDDKAIDLSQSFRGDIRVLKLVIEESGTTAESGVTLQAGSEELIIVAGAFPFTLAVGGVSTAPINFEPEYPLGRYTRAPFA